MHMLVEMRIVLNNCFIAGSKLECVVLSVNHKEPLHVYTSDNQSCQSDRPIVTRLKSSKLCVVLNSSSQDVKRCAFLSIFFLVFYFISEFFISLNFETIDLKSQHFLYHCRSSSRRNGASPNSIVHDTKNSVTTAACNKMAATSNTAQNTAHWQHGTKYKHKDMPNKNFVYLCV